MFVMISVGNSRYRNVQRQPVISYRGTNIDGTETSSLSRGRKFILPSNMLIKAGIYHLFIPKRLAMHNLIPPSFLFLAFPLSCAQPRLQKFQMPRNSINNTLGRRSDPKHRMTSRLNLSPPGIGNNLGRQAQTHGFGL